MNESNNNGPNERQEQLKQIIKDLHAGVPVEKLQKKFAKLIKNTSPEEIANMENALIQEGFPAEEIQRLCDIHVQVFEKTLSKIGKARKMPGHPVYSFLQENKAARKLIKSLSKTAKRLKRKKPKKSDLQAFEERFQQLKEIEKHYLRKENQLFPALEAKGFTGPTQVMWGKHNEIRELFKATEAFYQEKKWPELYKQYKALVSAIKKMIFLEEKILYPTSLRKLTDVDWAEIKSGESEIGHAWITPSNLWDANIAKSHALNQINQTKKKEPTMSELNTIKLEEGQLTAEQLTLMLKNLPVDITFVDENDKVCFYSANKDRIFPRSPGVIGRAVQNCHPPKSVHIVNDIIKSFRAKEKDVAEFWIQSSGKFIHIRYFPIYNAQGDYKGVIEVTQEISGIRALEGERRILDW